MSPQASSRTPIVTSNSPLGFLGPAIELIGTKASVLPATGGAFEDLARPDIEEADDRFFGSNSDARQGFEDFAEDPAPDWRSLYRPTPPIFRSDKHVYRYFCDGSIKAYFLGTVIEDDQSYPLELTQIGCAIVHRKDNGSLEVAASNHMADTPEETQLPVIGKTSAAERDANSSDKFSFWFAPSQIVNPFDIVQVEHMGEAVVDGKPSGRPSSSYGLVTTIEHRTDSPNHLANFVSSNFGDVNENNINTPRVGTNVAKVNILSNNGEIYMPVQNDRPVSFASPEGIQEALGIPNSFLEPTSGTRCSRTRCKTRQTNSIWSFRTFPTNQAQWTPSSATSCRAL